jgi:hypothetical protein
MKVTTVPAKAAEAKGRDPKPANTTNASDPRVQGLARGFATKSGGPRDRGQPHALVRKSGGPRVLGLVPVNAIGVSAPSTGKAESAAGESGPVLVLGSGVRRVVLRLAVRARALRKC